MGPQRSPRSWHRDCNALVLVQSKKSGTCPLVDDTITSHTNPPNGVVRALLLEPATKVHTVGFVCPPVNEPAIDVVRVRGRLVVRQGIDKRVASGVSLLRTLWRCRGEASQESGRKEGADHVEEKMSDGGNGTGTSKQQGTDRRPTLKGQRILMATTKQCNTFIIRHQ